MLDFIRRGVRSWVAKLLLGLLVISFAVWGIGDVASGFSTRVATVGGQVVEADLYARVLRREQQRYGLDPAELRASGLDRFVLARMVREAALDDAAGALGVSAPDAAVARQVRAEPAFQLGGAFDAAHYAATVRRSFPTVAAYEETVRRALASAQISEAAQTGAVAPAGVAEAIAAFREEQRRFDALRLTARSLALGPVEPTEAELAAHLAANADSFTLPEARDVSWLHIDVAALAPPLAEDELRAFYDERRARYAIEESREIDQIVFDSAEAAAAARARLDAGALDFDALLAERGLSRADAALGRVRAGELRDERGAAAFALDAPGVAGPARTAAGYALLQVRAIQPAQITPFEIAGAEIAAEIGAARARPEADRLAEMSEDLRAGGASLEEVAADLGVALRRAEGLRAAGPPPEGLPEGDRALREAFALAQGAESGLIRLADGGYVIVRVDAATPPRTPSLEAIRDIVADDWRAAAIRTALAEAAEGARARVAAGEPLETVAAAMDATIETIGPLRRNDPDPRLDAAARAALFAGAPGAVAVSVAADAAFVAVLRELRPGERQDAAAAAIARALADSVAQDQAEYLGRALEAAAGVAINPSVIESVLAQIGA